MPFEAVFLLDAIRSSFVRPQAERPLPLMPPEGSNMSSKGIQEGLKEGLRGVQNCMPPGTLHALGGHELHATKDLSKQDWF